MKLPTWLTSLFRRRREPDRRIFRFFDGTRDRRADPAECWELLVQTCGRDPAELLADLRRPVPAMPGPIADDVRAKRDAAERVLADAALAAFDVEPLADDGERSGLTRAERVALVARFVAYLGGLAIKARPFGGSPSPTAAYRTS